MVAMTELPAELADLTDEELVEAFVRTHGITAAKAQQLVDGYRGRAKRDVRLPNPKSIDDFVLTEATS